MKTNGELQPYYMRLFNRISETHVYGARSAMSIASQIRDWSLGGWYNGGVTSNNIGTKSGCIDLIIFTTHSILRSSLY